MGAGRWGEDRGLTRPAGWAYKRIRVRMNDMRPSRHQFAKRAPKEARTGADGFVYDSRTEMLRGQELLLLQRAGEIRKLERQVRFPLEYKNSAGGVTVMAGNRVAHYTADFVYEELISDYGDNGFPDHWVKVIEDVKGYADESSKLRIRVFEAIHACKVTILRKERGKLGWIKE